MPTMEQGATPERLWKKRDVAAHLGVDLRTVERMRVPRVPLPGRGTRMQVRYDPAEVRLWWENHKRVARGLKPLPAGTRL